MVEPTFGITRDDKQVADLHAKKFAAWKRLRESRAEMKRIDIEMIKFSDQTLVLFRAVGCDISYHSSGDLLVLGVDIGAFKTPIKSASDG